MTSPERAGMTTRQRSQGLLREADQEDTRDVSLDIGSTREERKRPVEVAVMPKSSWLSRTHIAVDFAVTFLLLILFAALENAKPREVYMIKETLYKHSYPYYENTVPSWAVPVYSIGGPLVAFLIWKVVDKRRLVSWYDMYRVTIAMLFANFLTGAITNALKVTIGRPRPNFYFQCWPSGVSEFTQQTAFGGFARCADPSHAEEFRKSFPSGHSSWSAAGLGFLSFWLLGQTHAFVGRARAWAFMLSLAPSLGALVVGVSRITDYWHNVSDVCVGLGIGFAVAFVVYLQIFPFFTHELCHVPRYSLWEAWPRPPRPVDSAPALAQAL